MSLFPSVYCIFVLFCQIYIGAVLWTRGIDASFSRGGSHSVLRYPMLDAWFIKLP